MSSRTSHVTCWRASLIWWKCCLGTRHCNIGDSSSLRWWVYLFWEFSMRMKKKVAVRTKMIKKQRKRQGTEFYKCRHSSWDN
eukprot:15202563-Ditylum_brightwellii.AAC.1